MSFDDGRLLTPQSSNGIAPSLHNFTVPSQNPNVLQLPNSTPERVLLIHPPVYDTRLHWPRWQQPTLLLRLGAYLRSHGVDVRLLDTLHHQWSERLPRKRVGEYQVDDIAVAKWRYGTPSSSVAAYLSDLAKCNWYPDEVVVESAAAHWWEGTSEVVRACREQFPRAKVILVGAYPAVTPDHARLHVQPDEVVTEPWPGLRTIGPSFSLYEAPPSFACVFIGDGMRTAADIVSEITDMAESAKTQSFVIGDHNVIDRFPDLYGEVLERLAVSKFNVNLHALGNLTPSQLVEHPDLSMLMKQAGYVQIQFADDRALPLAASSDELVIESYRKAAGLLQNAGFSPRTEKISGALSVGRPGENVTERAKAATRIAHHAGSIIMVPYQPAPSMMPVEPLETVNGKLFPFRHLNQASYRDYLDLLGLGVVLNAKYRSRTFDFLGDGLIQRLFQDSVRRRAWEPDPEVKGSIKLPVVMR